MEVIWPDRIHLKYFDKNDKRIKKNKIPGTNRTSMKSAEIQILYGNIFFKRKFT